MKKITLKLFMLCMLTASFVVSAQQQIKNKLPEPINGFIRCASDVHNAEQLKEHPNMMGSAAFEQNLRTKIQQLSENQTQRGAVIRLPVVVHVIHSGQPVGVGANISDAQVLSQIQVLNEDYRRIPGTRGFSSDPASADTEIEFYLARQDPDCNPTTGINRRDMSDIQSTWPFQGATDAILKPMTIWDPSVYINMWTVDFSDPGLLGYAQFPGGNPDSDGVVMGYQYFGSNDAPGVSLGGAFNLGRTTTHELGHYFGLFHTFQGGCTSPNDEVSDTPAISGPTGGCPSSADDSCPGGGDDMYENYMDYTDDACMSIFTNGQKTRMLNIINTNRASLLSGNIPDMALPELANDASIMIEGFNTECGQAVPNIRITNFGTSMLTSATITYDINGGTPEVYNYSGNLAQNAFDTFQLPNITGADGAGTLNVSVSVPGTDQRTCNNTDSADYVLSSPITADAPNLYFAITTDDYSNETTWSITDGSGAVVASGGPYNGTSDDNSTFTATVPLGTNECFTVTIEDEFGDGICCAYGNGSYEVRENDAAGTLLASGGSFGSSESVNILANALSVDDYFANDNLYIYPNPTSNNLNIKVGNTNDLPNSYEIVNILGQTITRNTIDGAQDLTINTSSLSNGAYFIKIIKNDASVTIPFIKE